MIILGSATVGTKGNVNLLGSKKNSLLSKNSSEGGRSSKLTLVNIGSQKAAAFKTKKKAIDDPAAFALTIKSLGFMYKSGFGNKSIPLMEATSEGIYKEVFSYMWKRIEGGDSLAVALSKTNFFPKEFAEIVGVGESTGSLTEILEQYADYLTRVVTLKRSFKSALSYPFFMLSAVVVFAFVLILKLMPMFKAMAESMNVPIENLPFITQLLFSFCDVMLSYGLVIPIVTGSLFVVYLLTKGKTHMIKVIELIPKVKRIGYKLTWAQWLMLFSICQKSGMRIPNSLAILQNIPLPKELAKKGVYAEFRENISAGKDMADEMKRMKLPSIIIQLIGPAMKAGKLHETLMMLSEEYMSSLGFEIKEISAIIEPMIIGVVALVGGGIATVAFTTSMQITGSIE